MPTKKEASSADGFWCPARAVEMVGAVGSFKLNPGPCDSTVCVHYTNCMLKDILGSYIDHYENHHKPKR